MIKAEAESKELGWNPGSMLNHFFSGHPELMGKKETHNNGCLSLVADSGSSSESLVRMVYNEQEIVLNNHGMVSLSAIKLNFMKQQHVTTWLLF